MTRPIIPDRTLMRVGHVSGKWSLKRVVFALYLVAFVRHEKVDVLAVTEAQQRGIVGALQRRLGRGWAVTRRGEYLLAVRLSVVRPRGLMWLRRLTSIRGLIAWRQMWMASRNFVFLPTGRRFRSMVAHAPSGVQAGRRWSRNRKQVAASKDGFERWGQIARRGHRRGITQILTMDANLGQEFEVWLDMLTNELGGESVWEDRMPDEGTHGPRRVIDTAHVLGADIVDAWISDLERPEGLDHKSFAFDVDMSQEEAA